MSNDLADFNPFDSATLQCPFPHYAQMRDEQPVMLIESLGMYLVTRHDLVLGILRDPGTYSSMFGGASMPLPGDARAKMAEPSSVFVFPAKHFVTSEEERLRAIEDIKLELEEQLAKFKREEKPLEHERLKRRTIHDIALIREPG